MSIRVVAPIEIPELRLEEFLPFVVRGAYDTQTERWTLFVHHKNRIEEKIPGQLETDYYAQIDDFVRVVFHWTQTAAAHYGVGNWSFELLTYEVCHSITFRWEVIGV
jgi:hypothetical protein